MCVVSEAQLVEQDTDNTNIMCLIARAHTHILMNMYSTYLYFTASGFGHMNKCKCIRTALSVRFDWISSYIETH